MNRFTSHASTLHVTLRVTGPGRPGTGVAHVREVCGARAQLGQACAEPPAGPELPAGCRRWADLPGFAEP